MMKQNLRLIFMTLLCAVFSTAWGEEVVYKTLTFSSGTNSQGVSSYSNSWYATIGDFVWDINNFNNNNNGWNYIKCGSKNDAYTGTITTRTAIDKAITKVVITIDAITASNVNSAILEVASSSDFTNQQTINISKESGDVVCTIPIPTENQFYKISFDCKKSSSNGIVQISKVQYYYDNGSAPKTDIATLNSISPTQLNVEDAGTFTLNATFVDGLVAGDDYEVTWASDNTNVLEVNNNGAYQAHTAGTANITVTVTALDDETYNDAIQSFAVNVVDPNGNDGSLEKPYTVEEAITFIETLAGATSSEKCVKGIVSKVDKIDVENGYATYWISDDGTTTNQMEIYHGKYLEGADFTATDQIQVADVVKVYGKLKKYNTTPEFDAGSEIISLSRKEVIATINGISPTTLTVGDLGVFSLDADFAEGTTANEDYEVNWSSDNTSILEVTGKTYEAKATGTANVTVSVTVIDDEAYREVSKSFTVTVKAISKPTFSPAGGTYKNPKTVTISCETPGTTIYFTDNGEDPDASSTEYTEAITVSENTILKAIAKRGEFMSSVATAEYVFSDDAIEPNPKNINSNYFVKVTSVDDLEDGDAILIVNESAEVAMSTTQNTNNRGTEGITISSETIDGISDMVQKIVLVKSGKNWYLYAGEGFLYAASSSGNHLKTKSTADDNAQSSIIINPSDGFATIDFNGTYTHNRLFYNSSSNLFSCYLNTASQNPVQIYKEIERENIEDVTITFVEAAAGYATLYYGDRNLTVPEGVKAYPFKIDSEGKGTKLSPYSVIPQGEGVLLELDSKSPSTWPVTKTFTVSETAGSKNTENMLKGTDWDKTIVAESGYEYYKLSTNSRGQNVGFYYGAENGAAFKNAAHKAYLVASVNGGSVSSYVFDDTNSIKSVNSTENNNSQVYTISGVRINANNLPAGLYIVNGKKMIVK